MEVDELTECFQQTNVRYAVVTPDDNVLAVTQSPSNNPGPNRTATLITAPDEEPEK